VSKYLNKQTVIDVLKESDLQRDAINLLKVAGWLVFRMNAGRAKFNVSLCPAGLLIYSLSVKPGERYGLSLRRLTAS
jgi:hypothetical protein